MKTTLQISSIMLSSIISACISCFCVSPLLAQTTNEPDDYEFVLEALSQGTEESPELDIIEFYSQNKIFLRAPNARRELEQLPGFSRPVILQMLKAVRQDTSIKTLEDLRALLRFSEEQFAILKATTTLDEPPEERPTRRKKNIYWRVRNRQRFNDIRGFEENDFRGSRLELYNRLNYFGDGIEAGFLTDKDAGEERLYDFTSGYISADVFDTQVLVGDFSLQSGMGSILWRPFGARKGVDVINPVTQFSSRFTPYRSTTEQQFFRGITAQREFKLNPNTSVKLVGWYSSINRPASIDTVENVVTSFKFDGLFRTESEINRRDGVREVMTGGTAELFWGNVSVGGTVYSLQYDLPIVSSSRSAFRGKTGVLSSAFATFDFSPVQILSEVSTDADGNMGLKSGLTMTTKEFNLAAMYRYFSPDFRAPYGYNFGETSPPSNESGLYLGIYWKGSKDLKFFGYVDLFGTPAPTSTVPIPVKGVDVLGEFRLRHSSRTSSILRFRTENKTNSITGTDAFGRSTPITFLQTRSSVRAEVNHRISPSLQFRSRFEACVVDFDSLRTRETGVLAFADLRWQATQALRFGARAVYYSTDSFESALWQFELTMPGIMSNPALSGQGIRYQAIVQYVPADFVTLWLQGTLTARNETSTLGSGNTEILDNQDKQLILQAEFAW